MKIYHNPRCSKSRKTLNLIKEKTSKFEIIEYTKRPLKFDVLLRAPFATVDTLPSFSVKNSTIKLDSRQG